MDTSFKTPEGGGTVEGKQSDSSLIKGNFDPPGVLENGHNVQERRFEEGEAWGENDDGQPRKKRTKSNAIDSNDDAPHETDDCEEDGPSSLPQNTAPLPFTSFAEPSDLSETAITGSPLGHLSATAADGTVGPKRRGRPRKNTTDSPATKLKSPYKKRAPVAGETPKKRGRPPKDATKIITSSDATAATSPKKRGRPPKSKNQGAENNSTDQKKRGRPKKDPAENTFPGGQQNEVTDASSESTGVNQTWTPEEDRLLIDSVFEGLSTPPWIKIAEKSPNWDPSKCFARWTTLKKRLYKSVEE